MKPERAPLDRRIDLDRVWNHAAGLLLPIALLVGAMLFARLLERLSDDARMILAGLPLLIAVTGMAVAARFDRGRLLYSLAVMLLAYLVVRVLGQAADGPIPRLVWALICMVAPLALLALAWLDDPGVLPAWREPRLLLFLLPLIIAGGALASGWDGVLRVLAVPLGPLAGWSPIPPLGQLAFLVAAGGFVWRYGAQPTMQRGALLGAFVALLMMLHRPDAAGLGIALAGSAALLLTFAALQESWNVAYVDPLTDLPGRRALDELLRRLPDRYAIAMVDVDHFKRFNDTHGHRIGDEVLRLVAAHLREVGGGGLAHRYGGEEFTVVFPGLDAAAALVHLEIVREDIDEARFALRRGERRTASAAGEPIDDQPVLSVTVSIGVADQRSATRPSAVIEAADAALYEAKRGGRNQTKSAMVSPGAKP